MIKKEHKKTKKLKENPKPTKLKKRGDYITKKTVYNNSCEILHYPNKNSKKMIPRKRRIYMR